MILLIVVANIFLIVGLVANISTGDEFAGPYALLLIGMNVFMFPTIVAAFRGHPNRWPIAAINIFFGATGIGWFMSLIWALKWSHISETGSNGGESGLNLVVNDVFLTRDVDAMGTFESSLDSKLNRLADLHQNGKLTDDEYSIAKCHIPEGDMAVS